MERERVVELHYITPIATLASIMELGILSHRLAERVPHQSIADEAVQDLRAPKRVPGGAWLHDYVNTYFDARNPMMFRRSSHRRELAVIRVSPAVLDIPGTVISDGNAASGGTAFHPSPAGLTLLDADRVYAEYWTDADQWTYFEKKRQRCAEVLVPDRVAPELVLGCFAFDSQGQRRCGDAAPGLDVVVRADVFFG